MGIVEYFILSPRLLEMVAIFFFTSMKSNIRRKVYKGISIPIILGSCGTLLCWGKEVENHLYRVKISFKKMKINANNIVKIWFVSLEELCHVPVSM